MSTHIFTHFSTELDELRKRVVHMGEKVCLQIDTAMDAVAHNDMQRVEDVLDREKEINREEIELDDMCVNMIVRHAPAARDLRMLMTTMRMITDIERVGDEAKKIAKSARKLIDSDASLVPNVELRYIAQRAVTMLNKALDAYIREDPTMAAELAREDKQVDAMFKGMLRQLTTFVMEDPRLMTRTIDIIFIAKAIERIGDHATNISEHVVYMVSGLDVRHISAKKIEAALAQDTPTN